MQHGAQTFIYPDGFRNAYEHNNINKINSKKERRLATEESKKAAHNLYTCSMVKSKWITICVRVCLCMA